MKFNDKQLEAINSIDGTIQVISAAGSGKSTTLVSRVENMISKGIPESEILAISFTNASASDLSKKLEDKNIHITSGTFHSICMNLLKGIGIDVLQFPNTYKVKRELEMRTGEKNLNMEDIMSWISYQKAYNVEPSGKLKEKDSQYEDYDLRKFYKIYEQFKDRTSTFDFDDFINLTNKKYASGEIKKQWKYVLCDECQDLCNTQQQLIDHFCSTNNIFEVGDYFQSIYKWRGAEPRLFKEFPSTHPNTKVINMNINYRSCRNIVEASNKFIRRYKGNYAYYMDAEANNQSNGVITCKAYNNAEEESIGILKEIQKLNQKGIDFEDMAIIYRNNTTSDYIEALLKEFNIPYHSLNTSSFFERAEIKGVVSALRLVHNITDDEAFENLLNVRFYPLTYYKKDLVDTLRSESGRKNISMYEAFIQHKFSGYEQKNAETFSDIMDYLRIQKDKSTNYKDLVENIIKSFGVRSWIRNKFEPDVVSDKNSGLENLKGIIGKFSDLNSFIKLSETGFAKKKKNVDGVELCTIHKSKGKEYTAVFLIGLEEDKFPSGRDDISSEARLMYVACTRAKEYLYVSSIGNSQFYDEYKRGINDDEKSV